MGQEYIDLLYRLKRHFDISYDEYMKTVLQLDKVLIFESASDIVAAKETHMEMCFWIELCMCNAKASYSPGNSQGLYKELIGEADAADLLSLEDPLKELASKWWFHTLGNKVDFHEFYKAVRIDRGKAVKL